MSELHQICAVSPQQQIICKSIKIIGKLPLSKCFANLYYFHFLNIHMVGNGFSRTTALLIPILLAI